MIHKITEFCFPSSEDFFQILRRGEQAGKRVVAFVVAMMFCHGNFWDRSQIGPLKH